MCSLLRPCLSLVFLLLIPALASAASLDVPSNGDTLSGIGIIHGWKCTAEGEITVAFNGGTPIPATYGSPRSDTRAACGDEGNTGFYTYWNWAILGDGKHTAVAYDNGVAFARRTFMVTTAGEEFVIGAQAQVPVPDFPHLGETTWFAWNQSTQHLEMARVLRGIEPEEINALLEPIREKYELPALAGGILHAGAMIGLGAVGVRRVGSPERVTVQDRWHLGSCTKTMTATLIATLVDEGVLSWQTTIGEAFPDFRATSHPAWQAVTVEQLLAHLSGLPSNDGSSDQFWAQFFAQGGILAEPLMEQRRSAVELMLKQEPAFPPGSRRSYSNLGYIAAGAIAEAVTGQVWEELMAERLFVPLGMASAGFGAPGNSGTNSQPRGHHGRTPLEPGPQADAIPAHGPAGTVHSSLADWGKFIALHLAGARGESAFLTPGTFQKLQTVVPVQGVDAFPYALGWDVGERIWAGGRALFHAGSNTYWFTVVWVAPSKDFAVLIATNAAEYDRVSATEQKSQAATDEAAWALIQHFLEE